MDFSIFSRTRFKAGVEIHHRLYSVYVQRDGRLKIQNIRTGKYIFKNLDPATLTVAGDPYDFEALQDVLYHRDCICDFPDGGGGTESKIFDLSFDKTFE